MSERYTAEQIREYWIRQAATHGQSPSASWSDVTVIELETAQILARLEDGQRVLDVGCGNGHATVRYAAERKLRIRGIDYTPEMVAAARERLAPSGGRLTGSVEFAAGDVTRLEEPSAAFDVVIAVRVIINLESWDRQLEALGECARVLRPGGTLLLSEATVQGLARLNRLRCEWHLPELEMPPFNRYLDEERLAPALAPRLRPVEVVDFSSTYYVGTRVLKPLLARALGGGIEVADPGMEWNRWFGQLPACGDYGVQKLFVFRRE